MKQNVYLWSLASETESEIKLAKGEVHSFSIIEPFDGCFEYDVYLRYQTDEHTHLDVKSDGENFLFNENLVISKGFTWSKLGIISYAKGEHVITIKNVSADNLKIEALMLTYDKDYIQSCKAASDADLLVNGEQPDFSKALLFSGENVEKDNKKLAKAGFLERVGQKTSEGKCRNGVPMGGIGTGKVEIDKDGVLTAITINNNFDVPIFKTEGSFFALRWENKDVKQGKILQKTNYNKYNFPCIEDINFTGLFPTANLKYLDKKLPFEISLNAFSSLIPYDIKNSSIPAVCYEFILTNNTDEDINTGIMFSWENIIGTGGSMVHKSVSETTETVNIMNTWNPGFSWSNRTGTFQKPIKNSQYSGFEFLAKSDNGNKESFGTHTVICEDENSGVEKTNWRVAFDGQSLWNEFVNTGKFTKMKDELLANDDESYIAGAISKNVTLKSSSTQKITFILSWYMPTMFDRKLFDMGVYYTNNFNSSKEVAEYFLENKNKLYNQTIEVIKGIKESSLEVWLQDKIINDMYPIYTNSWFAKNGYFAINEAPTGMMGCLGTLDQKLSSNVLYTNLFTALDKVELELFAECIGEDGSVSHDLGWGTFDIAKRGGKWSDLASSFILQVYKYYIYTGDKEFFKKMYPKMKAAYYWQLSIDYDKNYIPDLGNGNGTTYDSYQWYGTSSFVAGLWLCELLILSKCAKLSSDIEFAFECEDTYKKAQKSMIEELWVENDDFGCYFKNYNDVLGNKQSQNCFLSQLAGQWFASLMDIGNILPEGNIANAIDTIAKRNVFVDGYKGINDETTINGDFDWYKYAFVQYAQTYFACLAVYKDRVKEGIDCFKKINEMHIKSPWNVALTYHADGQMSGLPYYMTTPSSMFIMEAISGFLADVVNNYIKISPKLIDDKLKIPIFTPTVWYMLECEKLKDCLNINLNITKVIDESVFFENIFVEYDGLYSAKNIKINGESPYVDRRIDRLKIPYLFKPASGNTIKIEIRG